MKPNHPLYLNDNISATSSSSKKPSCSNFFRNTTRTVSQQSSSIPLGIFVSPLVSRATNYNAGSSENMSSPEQFSTLPTPITSTSFKNSRQGFLPYPTSHRFKRSSQSFDNTLQQMESKSTLIYKSLRGPGKMERITRNRVVASDNVEQVQTSSSNRYHLKQNFTQLYGDKMNSYPYLNKNIDPEISVHFDNFTFLPNGDNKQGCSYSSPFSQSSSISSDLFAAEFDTTVNGQIGKTREKFSNPSTTSYKNCYKEEKCLTNANDNFIWKPRLSDKNCYKEEKCLTNANDNFVWKPQIDISDQSVREIFHYDKNETVRPDTSIFDNYYPGKFEVDFDAISEIEQTVDLLNSFPSPPLSGSSTAMTSAYRNQWVVNKTQQLPVPKVFNIETYPGPMHDRLHQIQSRNRTPLLCFPEADGTFSIEEQSNNQE